MNSFRRFGSVINEFSWAFQITDVVLQFTFGICSTDDIGKSDIRTFSAAENATATFSINRLLLFQIVENNIDCFHVCRYILTGLIINDPSSLDRAGILCFHIKIFKK